MVNKVILVGRLGSDPEVRYTPDGTAVANFNLATSEYWKDRETGERREKTEWHKIVVWRKLAETCGEYLFKGKMIYLEGKLQTRSWEKDGVTRYITEVVMSELKMLPDGQRKDNNGREQQRPPRQQNNYEPPPDQTDDDIPF